MNNQNKTPKEIAELEKTANLSLNLVSIMVAFVYKWNKKELKDSLIKWVNRFTITLTEDEKKEFTEKITEMGLRD